MFYLGALESLQKSARQSLIPHVSFRIFAYQSQSFFICDNRIEKEKECSPCIIIVATVFLSSSMIPQCTDSPNPQNKTEMYQFFPCFPSAVKTDFINLDSTMNDFPLHLYTVCDEEYGYHDGIRE